MPSEHLAGGSGQQEYINYDDIQEGMPRITTHENDGIRTTTTTTRNTPDSYVKPKETVHVRTIQHPDSTETITVTEKKLPPVRYTETIVRETLPRNVAPPPPKIQITHPSPPNTSSSNGGFGEFIHPLIIPSSDHPPNTETIVYETSEDYEPVPTIVLQPTEFQPTSKTYNFVRRERVSDEPTNLILPPSSRQDRVIITQADSRPTGSIIHVPSPRPVSERVIIRQPLEPSNNTTIIRQPTPLPPPPSETIIQLQNSRPRIIEVRQPPPSTKTTTVINDNTHDTVIDDRRTLVNYHDDYYSAQRVGHTSYWCDDCGTDCFGDCCGGSSSTRRNDVVSYRTQITKDGRRVHY